MSSETVLVNKEVLEELLSYFSSMADSLDSYSTVIGIRRNEDEVSELISKLYEY